MEASLVQSAPSPHTTVQNNLRGQVDKILALTLKRNKIASDVELDPTMKEGTLFVMEDTIRNLTNLLPKLEELITAFIPGKAMWTLVFLLQKASEVTRLFNKQKSGSRARERVKILDKLTRPKWKTTKMEDDQNGRRPKWEMTKMEDDQNRRRPKWKTTKMEDDQNGRHQNGKRPKWKTTKMEYDQNGRQPKCKTTKM